eukprot:1960961-Rhodomonas_salina.1
MAGSTGRRSSSGAEAQVERCYSAGVCWGCRGGGPSKRTQGRQHGCTPVCNTAAHLCANQLETPPPMRHGGHASRKAGP